MGTCRQLWAWARQPWAEVNWPDGLQRYLVQPVSHVDVPTDPAPSDLAPSAAPTTGAGAPCTGTWRSTVLSCPNRTRNGLHLMNCWADSSCMRKQIFRQETSSSDVAGFWEARKVQQQVVGCRCGERSGYMNHESVYQVTVALLAVAAGNVRTGGARCRAAARQLSLPPAAAGP